jgi:uncharacterized protein YggT (Ycf19 family)
MRTDLYGARTLRDDLRGRSLPRVAFIGYVARVFDYLFGILYALFAVRFLLEFFEARPSAGFVQLIRSWTEVFYAPFRGMFATSTVDGGHVVWPLLVALLAYMVLHAAIRGLLRLLARA